MPPIVRIDDDFQVADGTNLNDYNNWQGYNFDLTPTDNIVINDNFPGFTDTGGKVMIKTIPAPIFSSSDINSIGDIVFFDSDVVHFDNSFILFCTDTSSRSQITNTGIRIQFRRRIGQDNQINVFLRNGGTLFDSGVIPATPARSVIFFQFTLSRSNAYNLIATHAGRAVQFTGTIDSPVQRNGREYVYYTDLNGVVSGTDECWSTIDRLFLNETLHGSDKITGQVFRRNQPVEGATVLLRSNEDTPSYQETTTDANGIYLFDSLNDDLRYDVMARYEQGNSYFSTLTRPGVQPIFIPD